jgi:small subunit ribosomal protein S17
MSEETNKSQRNLRKFKVGEVVSNKMDKTVVVRVTRRYSHPHFRKVVKSDKNYYAHDPENSLNIGDIVRIVETRPLSKLKRWRVEKVVRASMEPGVKSS